MKNVPKTARDGTKEKVYKTVRGAKRITHLRAAGKQEKNPGKRMVYIKNGDLYSGDGQSDHRNVALHQ